MKGYKHALLGFIQNWRRDVHGDSTERRMVRDGYNEDVASTWYCTDAIVILVRGRLRRYDLTLWERHVAFCADGNYEMFPAHARLVGKES
jgi:hypothetical protein